MLRIKDLSKAYNKHQALSNISFEVPKGQITGLLGHNGAGKTTLMRIITRILQQDSGEVILNDSKISADITRKEIGYLPEERGLYKGMKVNEYLSYIAKLRGIEKKERNQKIEHWIKKLNLQDWKNQEINALSKGMQQKVQFIAALLHNPSLLILDEPFSGFDPVNEQNLMNEIVKLKEKGVTILFSTHRMDSVEELCDNIVFLNKGKTIYKGDVISLMKEYEQDNFVVETTNGKTLVETENLQQYIQQQSTNSLVSINKEKKTLKEIFITKVNDEY